MSRRRDPVLAVMQYFETADVALAQQTLAIVQAIVKRRAPKNSAKAKPAKTKPLQAAVPLTN